MKRNLKKMLGILLTLALLAGLCACGTSTTPAPEAETTADPINIMTLSGTTGFGMAGLICAAKAGTATQNYNISVESDASNVTAALISGAVDIAALPTNAASTLYNKTKGQVQVMALNTLGVLYLVSDGSVKIMDFSSLNGKTVYVPAQNPSYIFEYLCTANGLTVGQDVIIDNTYAQPADLSAAMVSGQVNLAVLPEPLLSAAIAQNDKLRADLDLTQMWDMVAEQGSLVQGCIVVRKAYADEHPEQVAAFMTEYEASVQLCLDDPNAAATNIVTAEIFGNQKVAANALPRCNLCFITGEQMKTQLSKYLELMCGVNADSVGGAVPADDFYYIP